MRVPCPGGTRGYGRMTPDDPYAGLIEDAENWRAHDIADALRRLARIEAGARSLADELGLEPEEAIARALRFAGAAREMALRFHGVRGAPRLEEPA